MVTQKEGDDLMVSKEVYEAAENSLIDWLDLCVRNGLSIPEIVFLLQFRVFDLNTNARIVLDESTNRSI